MHKWLTDGFNLALVYLRKDYLQACVFTLVFSDCYVQVVKGHGYEHLLSRGKMLALCFSSDPGVKILVA